MIKLFQLLPAHSLLTLYRSNLINQIKKHLTVKCRLTALVKVSHRQYNRVFELIRQQ